jgi:hypothetical protein
MISGGAPAVPEVLRHRLSVPENGEVTANTSAIGIRAMPAPMGSSVREACQIKGTRKKKTYSGRYHRSAKRLRDLDFKRERASDGHQRNFPMNQLNKNS